MTAAPAVAAAHGPSLAPWTKAQARLLATGLGGALLVSTSAQFIGANLGDIQGAMSATADEASWISTVYTVASMVGIIAAVALIRTIGLGRYLTINAALFALTAFACAFAPSLEAMVALRALQGLAAGGFGPVAFVTVFAVAGGPRIWFGLTLLAAVLLLPGTLGPVVSGFLEAGLGWQALFLIQAMIGAGLMLAALAWAPRPPINLDGLKIDWTAMALLSVGLGALLLVLSQGARRFWFDSPLIGWSTAAALAGLAGFIFLAWRSPLPMVNPRLMLTRKFGGPITLNLVFRAGFVLTAYLVPQFLTVVQGYRPIDLSRLFLWALIPQLIALPLCYQLMHWIDRRWVISVGLASCGLAAALMTGQTSLASAGQFQLSLALFGVAQVLVLVPALLTGAGALTPPDFPTGSLFFNGTTLGGTTLGVGLVSTLATEREKLHSNILTEGVSLYDPSVSDRIGGLAAAFGSRLSDDVLATARAVAITAQAARREAWVLALNDSALLVAVILGLSALGAAVIGRLPLLPRTPRSAAPAVGDPS
jgi:DHA2 family multidrug resistance protein